jgi:hypothetical protein
MAKPSYTIGGHQQVVITRAEVHFIAGGKYSVEQQNYNLNCLFVYCTFVPAENSLNAQPSPIRKRCAHAFRQHTLQQFKKAVLPFQ